MLSKIVTFLSAIRWRSVTQWLRAFWYVFALVRLIGLNRTVMLLREARTEAQYDAAKAKA